MRLLTVVFLVVALLAACSPAPAAAQSATLDPADFPVASVVGSSPDTTFAEFQIVLDRWDVWYADWATDASQATQPDEQELYWSDLLARSIEHVHDISNIVWSDCYRPYAESYQRKMLWVTGYIAGVYYHLVAQPGVEPIPDEVAVTYQQVAQVWAIASNRDYELALEAC